MRAGIWREEWAGSQKEWFARTVDLVRPRTRLLPDFSGWARAFFSDDFEYEPEARAKFWKDDRLPDFFAKLADSLEKLPDWNHDACDHALRALAESEGVKAGSADKRDAGGHRGTCRSSSVVRYHGGAGTKSGGGSPAPGNFGGGC